MHYLKKTLLFSAVLLSVMSCRTPEDTIPYKRIHFSVSIPSTNLINVGGYEYFTGGVSGIVVYRFDMNTFLAYDLACPYDWEKGGSVRVENSIYLYDSLCGSIFNILDGSPVAGPAETPLRMYQTFMEDEFTLRVYN